jgi:surface polysaccharide O-acyltransferase-like enzyme
MTVAPVRPAAQQARPARRPHIVAFDLIRLIIMVFVVGVHTLAFGSPVVTLSLGAVSAVFHTSRELFFLLTALVLVYNYGHRENVNWPRFWRRRYWLVIPAYVTWSFIFFLADGKLDRSPGTLAAAFGHDLLNAGARYHLYFLLVTMQVYALFPLIRWLLRKTAGHHGLVFGLAVVYQLALSVVVQHKLGPRLAADLTGTPGAWAGHALAAWLNSAASGLWLESYVLYILGGAIVGWHFERVSEVTRRYANTASVTLVAGLGGAVGLGTYYGEVFGGHLSPNAASAVFQPAIVIEALCFGWALLAAGLLWADRGAPAKRFFAAGSASSFGIYLGHPLVLQFVLWLASISGFLAAVRGAGWALELLALLGLFLPVIYAGAWALASAARRTPLSLAFTGREYAGSKHPRRGRA